MDDNKNLSPIITQYRELKQQYPDALVMFRIGDFYEFFGQDAIEVASVLGFTLTRRAGEPMCGMPHHTAEGYIAKLIKLGKKVALCEQNPSNLTEVKAKNKILERGLVRLITAGTIIEDNLLEGKRNNYLVSASLNSNGDVGFSWLDISTGELNTIEFFDSDLTKAEDFLLKLNPSEIICDKKVYGLINKFEAVRLNRLVKPTAFCDYAYNVGNAVKIITDFYSVYQIAALGIEKKNFIISSLGGLLKYIEETQRRVLRHIDKPNLVHSSAKLQMDYRTVRNLEIVQNNSDNSSKGTLFDTLDKTKTDMGGRLLRKWLLEPLFCKAKIEHRQNAVAELLFKPALLQNLRQELGEVKDLERLSSKISYKNLTPNQCLTLANSLKAVLKIKNLLKTCEAQNLLDIDNKLNPLTDVAERINSSISQHEGEIIKSGFDKKLGEYRLILSGARETLSNYEKEIVNETGLKGLKIGLNKLFGYYIEASAANQRLIPFWFSKKQTLAGKNRYTTEKLNDISNKIFDAEDNLTKLENALYNELKEFLNLSIKEIILNARALAELDCLVSFATQAKENNYCQPHIVENAVYFEVHEGRHPVVEAYLQAEFVNNSLSVNESNNIWLITGANMAGKSTFMRQNALIALMAHTGSFVPATHCTLNLTDKIFTRIGASDNLVEGQSTFMTEMTEVAGILNGATQKSLLILDEIGRGTSSRDGLSLAWAIIEYISKQIKATTFFATHFHELCKLEQTMSNIKNYHFTVKESGGAIKFLYKIAKGHVNKSFGIEVASIAGVRKSVVDRAKEIMNSLENQDE
jgi:DNA mismatch repair protein MutS